ncbi:MAG: hypothetical protein HY744_06090 [Deltaproteobacteria bacterium]|nr:hypothetical protein [Deltaproteobacteria bacterium]
MRERGAKARDAGLMGNVSHSTYRLRISPWRDRSCFRVIQFRGDQELEVVHRIIQELFDLDDDHCWAFHLSGDFDDRETEYQGTPEGPVTRWAARLDSLDLTVGMRIGYVYDFGDNLRHDIDVLEVGTSDPSGRYPLVVEQQGKPPPQYPWHVAEGDNPPEAANAEPPPSAPDVPESLRQLHEPFLAVWDRCGEGDYDPLALDSDLALAERILEACVDPDDLQRFDSLGDTSLDFHGADRA